MKRHWLRNVAAAVAVLTVAGCSCGVEDDSSDAGGAAGANDNGPNTACGALIDLSSPAGSFNPAVQKYAEFLVTFLDDCTKDGAAFTLFLASLGGMDDEFSSVSVPQLVSPDVCEEIIDPTEKRECKKDANDALAPLQELLGRISQLKAADPDRPTADVVGQLSSLTKSINASKASSKKILVLTPGLQTAGQVTMSRDLNASNAGELVAAADAAHLVADLSSVDVLFVGVGNWQPDKGGVLTPEYVGGVNAFWEKYLEASGVADPAEKLRAEYTSNDY